MYKHFYSSWNKKYDFHEPIFSMGFDITKKFFDFGISISHIDMFMIYVNREHKQVYFSLIGFNFRYSWR